MSSSTRWLVSAFVVSLGAGCVQSAHAQPAPSSDSDLRLVQALQARQLDTARALIDADVDVDAVQADGATPLAWATHWNELDLVDLLLAAGADGDRANDLGVTPLMLAGANGSADLVDRLLAAGADANVARPSGETALMLAARSGSVDAVRRLVAGGAVVNAATTGGRTALMWAAAERHASVVATLAEVGASVDARTAVRTPRPRTVERAARVLTPGEAVNPADIPRDGDGDPPRSEGGFTPLLHAVLVGDLPVVDLLLSAGADVDDAGGDGVTALMLALTKRHEEVALFLIERGADPTPAEAGYTALHLAAATGQHDAARAIVAVGADVNVSMTMPQRLTTAFEIGVFASPGSGRLTQKGSTPFLVAAKSADAEMMRLLVDGGADPARTTDDGTNALMLAAGLGKRAATDVTYYEWTETKAIEALSVGLELGLDVDAGNAHGETALHAAAYHNANQVIEFLVSRDADIDVTNAAEQTPLRVAEGHLICCTTYVRHDAAATRLRELGADPAAGLQLTFGLTNFGDTEESEAAR
jgi:ankyrin repeat protein